MSTSRLWQKVGASAINCTLVVLLTAPLLPVLGAERWKILTISLFFIYNMICRKRCIGMKIVGTFIEPPTTVWYALTYTTAFATYFYSVIFPGDLAALNGLVQTVSYMKTGNTAHAWLAGQGTITREQYMQRCKDRAIENLHEGNTRRAVHEFIIDLAKYPDTKMPDFMVDCGLVLLQESDPVMIEYWIKEFN